MTEGQKKGIIYGIIGSASFLILYAAYSIAKQIKLAKQMIVKFSSVKVIPNVGKDMGIKIALSLQNKSSLSITADMLNFDIYINNMYINKILQKTSQTIKPNSESKIEFNVYYNPLEIFQGFNIDLILSAIDYKNLELRVVGYVSGSVDGINFSNFPFELKEKLGNLMKKP